MEDGSDSAALNRDWPAAVVAAVIIIVLGVVVYKAIDKYDANEVLNIWTGLTGILGGVIGAIGTFFFTRDTVKTAQDQAERAARDAAKWEERATTANRAFLQCAGHLDRAAWEQLQEQDPTVRMAASAPVAP